jgi:hypothetical protein
MLSSIECSRLTDGNVLAVQDPLTSQGKVTKGHVSSTTVRLPGVINDGAMSKTPALDLDEIRVEDRYLSIGEDLPYQPGSTFFSIECSRSIGSSAMNWV